MKKRVFGYARVSTEKQDLERQIRLIRNYCKEQEYYLVDIISEKVSGAKKDRESINRLLEVDSAIADMIVVSELSRLSREAEIMSLLSLVNDILNNGLDVLFLDSPNKIYNAYSTLSLIDIITLSVEAHAASEERNKIAIRMNTGIYTKFQVNPYIYTGGGAIPLGFKVIDNPEYKNQTDNRPAKSILEIDKKEIDIVKLIYNLVLQGNSCRNTAKLLTEMGYKTKLGFLFSENTISKLIRNPLYNGRRTYKDITLEIIKIIPDNDWNMAISMIESNQLYIGRGNKNFNPLKGIISCPCGFSLMIHRTTNRKNDKPHYMLQCTHQKPTVNSYKCHNIGIDAELLFKIVWYVVKQTLQVSEYAIKSSNQKNKENEIISQLEEQIYNITDVQYELKNEKTRLEKAIILVDVEELVKKYQKQYVEINEEIKRLDELKNTIQIEIGVHKANIEKILSVEKNNAFNDFTEKDKADLYRKVLKKVIYYSINNYKGFVVISYMNGFQDILAVKKGNWGYVALLPDGFKINTGNRKIIATMLESQPNNHPDNHQINYDLNNGKMYDKEFSFNELESSFNLEDWYIKI